jgi:ABC-2 type transport system ATP-binding protein
VTWNIGHGITGLLGPNGAGKSTLLSLIVTLLRPNTGKLSIGNYNLMTKAGRKSARRLLGYMPQQYSLPGAMRVHDCVAYASWVQGLAERECDAAAVRALEEVGLDAKSRDRIRTLSGGERQRLGLAAALAHNPAILILDEPTVGLDPVQRLRLREHIGHLGKERTVVIASHLLEDIEHLCHDLGVLYEGRVAFTGTPRDLSKLASADSDHVPGTLLERAYDSLLMRAAAS